MSRLTYRAATAADLPFIVGIMIADSVTPVADKAAAAPDFEETLALIDADPNQELFVAELGDEPVGTFQLTYTPGIMRQGRWRGTIEGVHVAPTKRNQGFGAEMIRWACEHCRARGCHIVQLTSNKLRLDAHRFYERLGFARSHEGFKLYL